MTTHYSSVLALGLKLLSDCIWVCSSWAYSFFHIYPHIFRTHTFKSEQVSQVPAFLHCHCLPASEQYHLCVTADPETLHLFSDPVHSHILDMSSFKANTFISAFWPLSSLHPLFYLLLHQISYVNLQAFLTGISHFQGILPHKVNFLCPTSLN